MPARLRLGVLVSGRGSNLQAIIDAVESGALPACLAVVISDREAAPALERARRHGAPAVFVDPQAHSDREAYDRALVRVLDNHRADLVCLAGFMRVLGSGFVGRFRGRAINVHPSLLPAFPGRDAQRQALEHGVKVAGATVHFVDEGVDTGPIIMQDIVQVRDDDTEESLSRRILTVEHRLYPEAIRVFGQGRLHVAGRRVVIDEPAVRGSPSGPERAVAQTLDPGESVA